MGVSNRWIAALCVLYDDKNAVLVPPRDSERLALAIEDLLGKSRKAERVAGQAELDSLNFDILKTVDRIQHVYDDLMDATQP